MRKWLNLNLQTRLRLISAIERRGSRGLFRGSDLCLLPYKTATQSGVIATYSYETPVIAMMGGLGEYRRRQDRRTGSAWWCSFWRKHDDFTKQRAAHAEHITRSKKNKAGTAWQYILRIWTYSFSATIFPLRRRSCAKMVEIYPAVVAKGHKITVITLKMETIPIDHSLCERFHRK